MRINQNLIFVGGSRTNTNIHTNRGHVVVYVSAEQWKTKTVCHILIHSSGPAMQQHTGGAVVAKNPANCRPLSHLIGLCLVKHKYPWTHTHTHIHSHTNSRTMGDT